MTRLAVQAEIIKLAHMMRVPVEQLNFMQQLPAETLHHYRLALVEQMQGRHRQLFHWLALWVAWLPRWLSVFIVKYWLEPLLVAKVASHLSASRLYRIADKLPAEVLASVAAYLDPRIARELLQLLSTEQIVAVAEVLLMRRDFITMGRFVGMLSDDVVQHVAACITDESDLLEIAFHIESRERMDHLVHVLPAERIQRALLIIRDPSKRHVWPKLLALMSNIGYAAKRELGDLAVSQGDDVLYAIIQAAQEDSLWEDMLPVVACLSPAAQSHVANLPALREPEIIKSIIIAADYCDLWTDMLVVVRYMQDEARDAAAKAIAAVDGMVLHHIAYATLLRSQWSVTLDVVRRLPAASQCACYQILQQYFATLDPETYHYIHGLLDQYGIKRPEVGC